MANQVNTTIVRDDEYIYFGTSGPFRMRYSVTNTRLELTDAAGNVLAHWTDAGTTGNMTVTGRVTAAGVDTGSGLFTFGTSSELTIASGAVTPTKSYHRIDTEADASTDDLVTITNADIGPLLIIRSESSARDIVVKHGTGNIFLVGAADFTLDTSARYLLLFKGTAGGWFELGRH